ncbi:hypothetical protein CAOG_03709 [Capsaspora owczarzaki ATCC 30864]|uniref:hypothetical protein n=1 Tax=Capsaspora owczarzaki (strain ATCC 30864) TaxID=595528 RepID=UPI00035217EB|nr:hypothetical protein CAOG_03709 [Capsaspora owczarzaki ATCC 30864]|eukprot:XP_004363437.2 hypothetical protein CAOG_03709 [Capsaspora owczarzaki ATCC 30864]
MSIPTSSSSASSSSSSARQSAAKVDSLLATSMFPVSPPGTVTLCESAGTMLHERVSSNWRSEAGSTGAWLQRRLHQHDGNGNGSGDRTSPNAAAAANRATDTTTTTTTAPTTAGDGSARPKSSMVMVGLSSAQSGLSGTSSQIDVGSVEILPQSAAKDARTVFSSPFLKPRSNSMAAFAHCWYERGLAFAIEDVLVPSTLGSSSVNASGRAGSTTSTAAAAAVATTAGAGSAAAGANSNLTQAALLFARAVRFLFPSSQPLSTNELACRYMPAGWLDSSLRALAWHQHLPRLAVADTNDIVYLFDRSPSNGSSAPAVPSFRQAGSGADSPYAAGSNSQQQSSAGRWQQRGLRHPNQVDVTCMAWRPLSGVHVAVGCRNGIVLWNVPAPSVAANAGTAIASAHRVASATVLTHPGHLSVLALAWSPDGRLLASGSAVDTAIVIWDMHLDGASCTPIRRYDGAGCGNLSWSPDGNYLFAATIGNAVRLWNTRDWTCQRWVTAGGRCHTSAWLSDSSTVLFGIENDWGLYSIAQSKIVNEGVQCGIEENFSLATVPTADGSTRSFGGNIQSISLDPHSSRLVVSFAPPPKSAASPATSRLPSQSVDSDDDDNNDSAPGSVAEAAAAALVLRVRTTPILQFTLSGMIQGPPRAETPQFHAFFPGYEGGSLLAVNWLLGGQDKGIAAISLVPFNYVPEGVFENMRGAMNKIKTLKW